jgi:hypothetical protein
MARRAKNPAAAAALEAALNKAVDTAETDEDPEAEVS